MHARTKDHCYTHLIPSSVVNISSSDEITPEALNAALNEALEYLTTSKADLIRGDLVAFESSAGYRNEGIAIYDGNKIINLEDDIDEYDHVPKSFKVIQEFSIKYWVDLEQYPIRATSIDRPRNQT